MHRERVTVPDCDGGEQPHGVIGLVRRGVDGINNGVGRSARPPCRRDAHPSPTDCSQPQPAGRRAPAMARLCRSRLRRGDPRHWLPRPSRPPAGRRTGRDAGPGRPGAAAVAATRSGYRDRDSGAARSAVGDYREHARRGRGRGGRSRDDRARRGSCSHQHGESHVRDRRIGRVRAAPVTFSGPSTRSDRRADRLDRYGVVTPVRLGQRAQHPHERALRKLDFERGARSRERPGTAALGRGPEHLALAGAPRSICSASRARHGTVPTPPSAEPRLARSCRRRSSAAATDTSANSYEARSRTLR